MKGIKDHSLRLTSCELFNGLPAIFLYKLSSWRAKQITYRLKGVAQMMKNGTEGRPRRFHTS